MSDFEEYLNQFSYLDSLAKDELMQKAKTKTFKKGDHLLKNGKICKQLFFINEGLAKMYTLKDDKEFVMRFFYENLLFTTFDSYLSKAPTNFDVVALETTMVTIIEQDTMEELCKKHHCMETFLRNLISKAALIMIKRISTMLEENASERYNQFVKENNFILQRISLGDLAKYLGITQQSLSRIRAPS